MYNHRNDALGVGALKKPSKVGFWAWIGSDLLPSLERATSEERDEIVLQVATLINERANPERRWAVFETVCAVTGITLSPALDRAVCSILGEHHGR